MTLTLVDTPVVVVRGDDDRVRVLLNACRHRGQQVADGAVQPPAHLSVPRLVL
ncbi:MAG: Rieske 2Fe-2S domain-containing protein [Microthrixaceae bacterium]